jgi:alanyl-tRNA synthetase
MTTAEIRSRFLDFFSARGHEIRPSSSLVPADDPTLLFTNAGMVQFKAELLGVVDVPIKRAVTSQKCVRAGGKHNDLEEVGRTTRHHTFFEMLGNFSFGDYFKRDAIKYAWEFLTEELGLDPERLYVSIHHSDDEADDLWQEVTPVPPNRIFRLGDKDNFWQMADTGPCGPCSELHYDLRPGGQRGDLSQEEFEDLSERGVFIEIWNLVFMQYNRDDEGTLNPLPAPSIDTGAGLERIATVMQKVDSNYHIDAFAPLLAAAADVIGQPYEPETEQGLSYRVLADHARAVAFLLADGVFPSSDGRGYVLRRILRRAVRHAWLLGRREPTLVAVVESVVDSMSDIYPELQERRDHILGTTRAEEERFLSTIEGGMDRFDLVAPRDGDGAPLVVSGSDAFKLYDTFGFPLDLTQLMAGERGYSVDVEAFESALDEQRQRSRADRAQSDIRLAEGDLQQDWKTLSENGAQRFLGYDTMEVKTDVLAVRVSESGVALQLADNPFYAEGGGQVSDGGAVEGEGWTLAVQGVVRVGDRIAVLGVLSEGVLPVGPMRVRAVVDASARRDTQRNHTATHLLHAALRGTLGTHVVQRGSLVASDRLRFDFAHTAPMTVEERERVEGIVNEGVWGGHRVTTGERPYDEAVADGAMALFGEKYADVVRVVEIPGVSMELCGGTHVHHTGDIGLFKITSESGVAAGVRRIEAVTGPSAFGFFTEQGQRLEEVAEVLGSSTGNAAIRARQLIDEKREVETLLDEVRSSGGAGEAVVLEDSVAVDGTSVAYRAIRLRVRSADDVRQWGDSFLAEAESGVAVVAAELPGKKYTLFAFATDDLIHKGVRADAVVREVADVVGGKGGGRPHMAQAGVEDPERLDEALRLGRDVVQKLGKDTGD